MRSAFIALIVLGVVVRVALRLFFIDLESPELWEYSDIAENIIATGVFSLKTPGAASAFMPPFYPFFIAGIYLIFGTGYAAHLILALVLWATELLIAFLMGWLACRIWNPRAGQFALLISLFWPMLLLTSGRMLNVPIIAVLPMVSIAVMLSDLDRWKRILIIGLAMGLLWTNRFETPLFMLPLAYYFFFHDRDPATGRLPPLSTRVVAVGTLALILIAIITPWIVRNNSIYGQPLLSTEGGYHFRRGHHEGATGAGRDPWPSNRGTIMEATPPEALKGMEGAPQGELLASAYHREKALAWIEANPGREVQLIGTKLFYFLVSDFTHPIARRSLVWVPSMLALVLGLYHWIRTGLRDPAQQVIWMTFGIQTALCATFIVLPRYRIAVEFVPILFFSAWLADSRLGDWIAEQTSAEPVSMGVNGHR